MLDIARSAVCYNQGEIAQYFYLASYFHRDMKDALRREEDVHIINSKLHDLVAFINLKFAQICTKNFELIMEYFSRTGRKDLRICLKAMHGDEIVDIFRNESVSYFHSYEYKGNTGFRVPYETGDWYLNNNLPAALLDGNYANPRLDPNKIAEIDRSMELAGELWESLWLDHDKVDDPRKRYLSSYRSTLVVPLTLKNISLSNLFLELSHFPDVKRAVFGFLCFDSPELDFFVEDDVHIGYIFADLLSLYLINSLNYTEMSKSYKKAIQLVDSSF